MVRSTCPRQQPRIHWCEIPELSRLEVRLRERVYGNGRRVQERWKDKTFGADRYRTEVPPSNPRQIAGRSRADETNEMSVQTIAEEQQTELQMSVQSISGHREPPCHTKARRLLHTPRDDDPPMFQTLRSSCPSCWQPWQTPWTAPASERLPPSPTSSCRLHPRWKPCRLVPSGLPAACRPC